MRKENSTTKNTMEIISKIIASLVAYFLVTVFAALAFGAPIDKDKDAKREEMKQQIIYYLVLAIVLALIWFYW
jgi:cytochrome bd-type quinol oxidase subunit 2